MDSRTPQSVSTFVRINFLLAGLCLLVLGLLAAVLICGVFLSGDPADEIVAGVVGCAVLGAPVLLGLLIYGLAGLGLMRLRPWGYYLHIVGACLAGISCVGVIYTIFALIAAFSEEFKMAIFGYPVEMEDGDPLDEV